MPVGVGCWAFFQGTSMATPHLAGSAAVVIDQHPSWTAEEVRSAIVNTADFGVVKNARTGLLPVTDVNIAGAGRENLFAATGARVAIGPVSTSFGAVPSGAGVSQTKTVTLTDLTGAGGAYSVSVDPGDSSVSYMVSPNAVVLPPRGSVQVRVTMNSIKGAAEGKHQALLRINSGTVEVAHGAVFTFIK